MYLITFIVSTLSVLLLFTPTHCVRTRSPKYLFTSEANSLEDSQGAFVGSQDPNERFKRETNEEVQPNLGRSRFRRADDSSQKPVVKASVSHSKYTLCFYRIPFQLDRCGSPWCFFL